MRCNARPRKRRERQAERRRRLGLIREYHPAQPASPEARALGQRLRDARLEQKLTLTEVAARAGINKSSLSRWETGVIPPPLSQLQAVAKALGLRLVMELKAG